MKRLKLFIDRRAKLIIEKLPASEKARILRVEELFKIYGFTLGLPYLKKIDKNLWELRPGHIRLFLFTKKDMVFIIHALRKKTQKISKKDLKLIRKREKEY